MDGERNDCSEKEQAVPLYRIKVKGILDKSWSDWFDNLDIAPLGGGVTQLQGRIPDQSALFGLLTRIHNTGLLILEVKLVNVQGLQ